MDGCDIIFIRVDQLRQAELLDAIPEFREGGGVRGEGILPDRRAAIRVDQLENPAIRTSELINLDLHRDAVMGGTARKR